MASAEEFFGNRPSGSISPEQFFAGAEPELYEPQEEEEKLGFLQRFNQDIQRRVDMVGEIQRAMQDGEQSTAEGYLQLAGKVGAGAVLDFVGEGINSVIDMTPETIKSGVGSAASAFLNTDIGQAGLEAASDGVRNWEFFRLNNPRAARNIESVVNIGMLAAPPMRGAKPVMAGPPAPSLLQRGAQGLRSAAAGQESQRLTTFVQDLIRPKRTTAVKVDEVPRTTEAGILRNKEVALSPAEQRIAQVVESVPGVSPSNTLQGNYNAITQELSTEAQSLMGTLQQSPARISAREVEQSLNLAQQRLAQSPTIVGDAAKTAERLIDEAKRIVARNSPDSAGLLRSRQEFDRFVQSQKSATVFDPALENALSLAVREVRQTMNALIEIKNPAVGVRESLGRQSSMYRALDNIAPKAADEYSNAALRAWQNAMRILPLRGEFNQMMATAAGIGGLGAAAKFAPMFTSLALGGLGIYAGGRMIMSPVAKRATARLIEQVDEALKLATDADMIRQLRADRALLLEMTQGEQ